MIDLPMPREQILKASIYNEIDERWRAICTDMHRDPLPRDGFSELLLEAEAEARVATTTALQPHLAIFEFGLEFLAYVHVALSTQNGLGPSNEHTRAAWALTGSAVTFGVSIRSLVISGLDTPARALLRTYVESLLFCIAVLHDRALGEAYVSANTDAQIKDFWHVTVSPKRLHERIIAIEKMIGIDKEIVDRMTTWRREEYEFLSQSSHLSYLAASLTAVGAKLDEKEVLAPSMFGLASAHSPRTIFYAAATTWHFSRLSNSVLLGKIAGECMIVLDRENQWHQRMVAARETLSDVMLNHWNTRSGASSHADDPVEA